MKIFLSLFTLFLAPFLTAAQTENQHLSSLYRNLSEATSDTSRMVAYSNIGSYYLLEDRDSAAFYLEKALSIAVRTNLKFNEASILNKMGIIQMQQENFSRSLEFYLKAMHIAKDLSIEKTIWHLSSGESPASARMLEISRSYDLIGLLNAYTGNWTDNIKNQVKNYREAEKYAIAAKDSAQIATVIFHIGIAHMNAGKLDSALILLKNAQSLFSDLQNPQLGRSLLYLGETYEKMGNHDLAARSMLQGMALLNRTNDYLHRGLGYYSLSRVFADLNKLDSALHYAKESLKIFEKRKDPAWKRDACNALASYFEQLGRNDSATVYLKMAKSLSDSLNIEERKNLLAFQDVLIDEQGKLEKLEKEKMETREKIKIYLLSSGIVFFGFIVFLLYRNNQVRKKTNEILQQRNDKIENTLHQLRSTQAQLIQSEKMASLGELTAGIAHEIQNPLNFVNNFSEVNKELLVEIKEEINNGNLNEIIALANEVIANEEKISHHGKRADAIVKGMLQHSGSGSGKKEPTNINILADEYLRLAYHGFKAKEKSFEAELKTEFDPHIGTINIVPQEIGRVLLNLFNNAFFAVNEKMKIANKTYEPGVTISTRKVTASENSLIHQSTNSLIIVVKDNGNGIPQKILDKIFQPFFTTKPTGQGTGLGLSLSYDIVKAHGGELSVETNVGEGSSFILQIPYA